MKQLFVPLWLCGLLPFGLLLLLAGCNTTPEEPLPPPNIIWINAEDISPAWGCYGDNYAKTPRLDQLAQSSLRYDRAYATAPICAPSRSCLITGVYATAMGTQHLRNEIPRTPGLGALPEYLKEAGYYTTLYGKTDYNFTPDGIWDYWKNDEVPWRQRPEEQPFFSMFTFGMTHEGRGNFYDRYQEAVNELPEELFHDPAKAPVPPYYPQNEEARKLWARYYDLISAFDTKVGQLLDSLEADGLMENTILFVFADHGFGMPRYKRWLNETGLRVPLLLYIPEAYKEWYRQGNAAGQATSELVSFVDYAPTTLALAGVAIPDHMQGKAFAGPQPEEKRQYIFGARSRADDMYEISRAVRDDRFFYTRHYLPHYPYIQPGRIFDDRKEAFALLRKARTAGELPPSGEAMFHRKPIEELYDLENDPQELNNLADDPEYAAQKEQLSQALQAWMLEHRDAGLLIEPEMMRLADEDSPYTMAQSKARYPLEDVIQAAEWVEKAPVETLVQGLKDPESGVRWWAATALRALESAAIPAKGDLETALQDPSPAVQVAAAEALCALGACNEKALQALATHMQSADKPLALYAARTVQLLGEEACKLKAEMTRVRESYLAPPGSPRPYVDFNFASFIGWTLEVPLENCN